MFQLMQVFFQPGLGFLRLFPMWKLSRLADMFCRMCKIQNAHRPRTAIINPKSAQDVLGNAFSKMVSGLHEAVGMVAESANAVTSASAQLASASGQTGEAANLISITTQQVAMGITQQSDGISRTTGSVE
jgi:methyl-accepting chemotaxis protein